MNYSTKRFSLKLNKPLNLKRRRLLSSDPYIYKGELISCTNKQGQTGYGELVHAQELAEEIAQLNLRSLETGKDPIELLGRKRQSNKIQIAAMLDALSANTPEEAYSLVSQGFKTLKFKITSNFKQEASILNQIYKQLGSSVKIRLDANQNLDLDSALYFANLIQNIELEYFEEPLKNPFELSNFHKKTGIKLALDESLAACHAREAWGENYVTHFALKPYLMPNLKSILDCIELAEQNNIQPVICSAFETGLSLNFLAQLHASLKNPPAAGLSTYRWFDEDLITPRFKATDGCVFI